MKTARTMLEKHKSIRLLLPPRKSATVMEMRKTLQWHSRITGALHGYLRSVTSAFKALLCAVEHFDSAVIGMVPSEEPMVDALLCGIREAYASICEVAQAANVPLEIHQSLIVACMEDLFRSDQAENEERHYRRKLECYEDDDTDREQPGASSKAARAEARSERNRSKYHNAKIEAAVSKARSENSMEACLSRTAEIQDLVRQVVKGTAEALRCGMTQLASDVKITDLCCGLNEEATDTTCHSSDLSDPTAGASGGSSQAGGSIPDVSASDCALPGVPKDVAYDGYNLGCKVTASVPSMKLGQDVSEDVVVAIPSNFPITRVLWSSGGLLQERGTGRPCGDQPFEDGFCIDKAVEKIRMKASAIEAGERDAQPSIPIMRPQQWLSPHWFTRVCVTRGEHGYDDETAEGMLIIRDPGMRQDFLPVSRRGPAGWVRGPGAAEEALPRAACEYQGPGVDFEISSEFIYSEEKPVLKRVQSL